MSDEVDQLSPANDQETTSSTVESITGESEEGVGWIAVVSYLLSHHFYTD